MSTQGSALNFATLAPALADEDAAREFIESIRWPNGPECPHCGSQKAYKLNVKPSRGRPVLRGLYKCKECRRQFTVTEFDFRWSRRKAADGDRLLEALRNTKVRRLYYREPAVRDVKALFS